MAKKKYVYTWEEIPYVIDPPYAAFLLGCTTAMIRKLCRDGILKGFKVGDMWRIKKEDLKDFMEGGTANA